MTTKRTTDKKVARRKFLKGVGVAAGAGVATVAMPNVSRAQTTVFKMQSSWGAGAMF